MEKYEYGILFRVVIGGFFRGGIFELKFEKENEVVR